jgi:hypothetical protein
MGSSLYLKEKEKQLNSSFFHAKLVKKVNIGGTDYDLMYLKLRKGKNDLEETVYDYQSKSPVFVVKYKNKFRRINHDGNVLSFGDEYDVGEEEIVKNVEVFAYRSFEVVANELTEKNPLFISADYDELTSALKKVLPMEETKYREADVCGELLSRGEEPITEFTSQIDGDLLKESQLFPSLDLREDINNIVATFGKIRSEKFLVTSLKVNGNQVEVSSDQVGFLTNLLFVEFLQQQKDFFNVKVLDPLMGAVTEDNMFQKIFENLRLGQNVTSHAA